MTKKRSADSKFSEFKGGDLNKYTARSYTIQNGNEIFGGKWRITFFSKAMLSPAALTCVYLNIFVTVPASFFF